MVILLTNDKIIVFFARKLKNIQEKERSKVKNQKQFFRKFAYFLFPQLK